MKKRVLGLLLLLVIALPTSLFADSASYNLVKALYPIKVNDVNYVNIDLPILNYNGTTYIPLRAVGDMLDANVVWNRELSQVEITTNPYATENSAFRDVTVDGSGGVYNVKGEARVFEAVMNYRITDGQNVLLDQHYNLKEGAPAWSAFALQINIPKNKLPHPGLISLQLYEVSAKDGSRINRFNVPLEIFR